MVQSILLIFTQNWLKNQNIYLLDWPAQSPDLNQIEHLWSLVKRQLSSYESIPVGVNELFDRFDEIWSKIEPSYCQDLIKSMPERIKVIIKAKGGYTRY